VNAARDELLARPRLAVNEHARVARGDARDELVHSPHHGARSDHPGRDGGGFDLVAKKLELRAQAPVLDGARNREPHELRVADRLRHEVIGTGAHGGDRCLQARVARHDDDGEPWLHPGDLLADPKPGDRSPARVP
jgi:hypothetical protein